MQPFFLPSEEGQRFCLFHAPLGAVRGAVIYLAPFAEEMNRARRMAALQARAMAEAGFAVLQIDLYGCGDSAGDFGDASWQIWQQDVLLACQWLQDKTQAPLTFWGLRAGCLLATTVAVNLEKAPNFIFWQPVISGRQHGQQLMRLKQAGALLSGQAGNVMAELRHQIEAGQPVEIAGYTIAPELAKDLANAVLQPPAKNGRLDWFELSMQPGAERSPIAQEHLEQWQTAGYSVRSAMLHGPAFWQTHETEEVPALIAATLAALEAGL